MRIILVDARDDFRSNINLRLMIDDYENVEVVSDLKSAVVLETTANNFNYDVIVACSNVFHEVENWKVYGDKVVGYSCGGEDLFAKNGIASYGEIKTVNHLLNSLQIGLPSKPNKVEKNPVAPKSEPKPVKKQEFIPDIEDDEEDETPAVVEAEQTPAPVANNDTQKPEPKPEVSEQVQTPAHQSSIKERMAAVRNERANNTANSVLKKELEEHQQKTQVVTVYAAKGGVGKTTVSTELAVYLSMTSAGRSNYRVCLVDYNIDFGDVLTTLDYSADGQNLSFWASEVTERLENGEKPEDIQYSQAEIEQHLQRMDKTGLYALVAPITHEDSMMVGENELRIILDNIVNNGHFDFVVCDTGNNTRDSSIIALEKADYVLLIATQDVSTASCNDAFLSTMKKLGFDTGKIRLIVNNIHPYKYTQVAVQEIEDMFPFGCVARIKNNCDVLKANNTSEPLVYQMNHEFTKEIRSIVQFLTGKNAEIPNKSKGLFGGLFGKKR